MSGLMLASLLPSPPPPQSAALKTDTSGANGFAGVLASMGAPANGQARRKPDAGTDASGSDAAGQDDDTAPDQPASADLGSASSTDAAAALAQALIAALPQTPPLSQGSAKTQPKPDPAGTTSAGPVPASPAAGVLPGVAPVPAASAAAVSSAAPPGAGLASPLPQEPGSPPSQTGRSVQTDARSVPPQQTSSSPLASTNGRPAAALPPQPDDAAQSQPAALPMSATPAEATAATPVANRAGSAPSAVGKTAASAGSATQADRGGPGVASSAEAARPTGASDAVPGNQSGSAGSGGGSTGQQGGGASSGHGVAASRPQPTDPQSAAVEKTGGTPAELGSTIATHKPLPSAQSRPAAVQDVSAAATAVDPASPPATPAQQIASALQSFIEAAAPAKSDPVSGGAAASTALDRASGSSPITNIASGSVGGLKSLTIDLDPGHLGPVSITMRLKGDAMSIQIAVDNPETLRLLDRDKHLLTAAVVASGGSSDALQIGRGTSAEPASQTAAGGFGQSAFQDQSGRQAAFSSDTASTGRQAQSQGRRDDGRAEPETSHDDPTSPSILPSRSRDGSLYL